MHLRMNARVVMITFCASAAGIAAAGAGHLENATPPARQPPRQAVERGLAFLQKDAEKWRAERKCASCHQGTMTVWVLAEAKSDGYPIAAETLAEAMNWTKESQLQRLDAPRDTRPGWNMVSTPALYLAVMARTLPRQEAVNARDLQRIASHLRRHQEADGSWAWSLAPAQNRPPPVFESDEVVTRMARMCLEPRVPTDAAVTPAALDSVMNF